MLTLFTMPKPFRGHIDVIQRNAVESWIRLHRDCQVILLGDEPGTADLARQRSLDHVPDVPRNEFGTPLLNGLFDAAAGRARHPVLCFINADIILLPEFADAVRRVTSSGEPSVMVGQRWGIRIDEPLDFSPGWDERLRACVNQSGRLHGKTAIDYFVHAKHAFGEIPPFAIGRTLYDNWLLYRAIERGQRLIDATRRVMVVHQEHDYSHLPGGKKAAWQGEEALRNRGLARGPRRLFTLREARWVLTRWGVLPNLSPVHLCRRLVRPIARDRIPSSNGSAN